ncbi:MAG: hypothetical protein K2N20_07080, partial [Helicobacter sp.]|nr:hypothetical protein [Helicobacter sp.]
LRTDYVMPHSAASMLCLWDPNIDVARCGWEIRIMSNSKEMFRLRLNMTIYDPPPAPSAREGES